MKVFDRHFRTNKLRYLLQSMLIGAYMLACVLLVDIRDNPLAVTCLAASAVVVLAMPRRVSSRVVYVLGGYLASILAAGIFYWLGRFCIEAGGFGPEKITLLVFGAAAVAAAAFFMGATNTEHPPAAGFALSLAMGQWDIYLIVMVLALVAALLTVRTLLKRWLIDLL